MTTSMFRYALCVAVLHALVRVQVYGGLETCVDIREHTHLLIVQIALAGL